MLAFLLPIAALGAIWAIRRRVLPRRAWSVPLGVAAALAVSAWAAVETGEAQDERVERVVAEQPLSAHEQMAETFLTASGVLVLVAAVGLIGGIAGRTARITTTVGSLALLALAARVGHSGGQLVYKYGAAAAYTSGGEVQASAAGYAASAARTPDRRAGGDDDDHR